MFFKVKYFYSALGLLGLVFFKSVFGQEFSGGQQIVTDTENLRTTIQSWTSTAALAAVGLTFGLSVISLILPWPFFKETIGRKAWIGVIVSVVLFIIMSFFGASIGAAIHQIYSCPLSVMGISCS